MFNRTRIDGGRQLSREPFDPLVRAFRTRIRLSLFDHSGLAGTGHSMIRQTSQTWPSRQLRLLVTASFGGQQGRMSAGGRTKTLESRANFAEERAL